MRSALKSIIVFLFALLFVLSIPLALAEEAATVQEIDTEITLDPAVEEEAGITASNPFWGIERAFEKISLSLTFSRSAKAEKGLLYANERLAELQVLIAERKLNDLAQTQQAYEEELGQVAQEVETFESGDAADGAEDALEDVVEIQSLLNAHYEKVSSIKDEIIEQQEDRMSEEEIAQVQDVFSEIESKAQEAENQIMTKRENAKLKYKVLSETTDDEVEKVEQEIDQRIKSRSRDEIRKEVSIETEESTIEEKTEVKDDETKIKIESEEKSDEEGNEESKTRLEKR